MRMLTSSLLAVAIACGCAARIGPGEDGWLQWDICGFEGGVAAELTILAMTARLGCTNPELVEDPDPELEVTP